MHLRRALIIVLILVVSSSCLLSTAESADDWYKSFYSNGWFGTYALREFDKVAPPPGVNWYVDDAQDWLARAERDGWVVKRKPVEAIPGSIILGYENNLVWVGIAREVTNKGLIFETVMGGDGKPARYWLEFPQVMEQVHFKGAILPVRITGAVLTSPMEDYKGLKGAAGVAWPVREFDKIAPKPDFNWPGKERDWPVEAKKKGWAVKTSPSEPAIGALLLLEHVTTKNIVVGIVREIYPSVAVFDYVDTPYSRVNTLRLTFQQMLDPKAFGGYVFKAYIWAEQVKKK